MLYESLVVHMLQAWFQRRYNVLVLLPAIVWNVKQCSPTLPLPHNTSVYFHSLVWWLETKENTLRISSQSSLPCIRVVQCESDGPGHSLMSSNQLQWQGSSAMTHRPHYNDRTDLRLFQYSCKVVIDLMHTHLPWLLHVIITRYLATKPKCTSLSY